MCLQLREDGHFGDHGICAQQLVGQGQEVD